MDQCLESFEPSQANSCIKIEQSDVSDEEDTKIKDEFLCNIKVEQDNRDPVIEEKFDIECLDMNAEEQEDRIKLGGVFNSYEDFCNALHVYSSKKFVVFYKREARTISAAKKKTGRYINSKLKYYQLKYSCIKGGREFKAMGNGKRNSSTFKNGCNAHITLRASHCGNKLQIIRIDTNHNHEISKPLFDLLPHQRRLPEDIQSEIVKLTKLKARKKEIKSYVQEKSNKIILLKDAPDVNLQNSVEKLQTRYAADCQILSDEDNKFKALFFQTNIMKQYMSVYPEFICIDATFKLFAVRNSIVIIFNEDGNGLSEIVAVGVMVDESSEIMAWFLSKFKANNPSWTEIKSIIADKDLNDRRLLKEIFPGANVVTCIFHAMKIFNKEMSIDRFGLTAAERNAVLQIFQKMVYSRNSASYNALYEDLLKNCHHSVVEYFNKNWHDIRNEWTFGPKFQQSNFLHTTNNRLESLNAKIKASIEKFSSLTDFIDSFFNLILVINDERDQKAANFIYKVPISFYEKDSELYNYSKYLTSYAFEFVRQQFLLRNSDDADYKTTNNSCTCQSRASMILPCRHIFKKRQESCLDLYQESLCRERWTRQHYYSHQRLFLKKENECAFQKSDEIVQNQKFNKAWVLLKSMAGLLSEDSNAKYNVRIRQLIQLKTAWEQGKNVAILAEESDENVLERNNQCGFLMDEQNMNVSLAAGGRKRGRPKGRKNSVSAKIQKKSEKTVSYESME